LYAIYIDFSAFFCTTKCNSVRFTLSKVAFTMTAYLKETTQLDCWLCKADSCVKMNRIL